MILEQNTNVEVCGINADGTTFYDWDAIEEYAAKWHPYCNDTTISVSKLLLPLKPTAPMTERVANLEKRLDKVELSMGMNSGWK